MPADAIYKVIVFMNTEHRDGRFNKVFEIPVESSPFKDNSSVIQSGHLAVRNGLKLYGNKGAQVFKWLDDIPGNLKNKDEVDRYDWFFAGMEAICMELVKVVVKGTLKKSDLGKEKALSPAKTRGEILRVAALE